MSSNPHDLRVMVVADDPLARGVLSRLVEDEPTFVVVAQIGGEADLAVAVDVYRPDVLLWDLGWDSATGFERLANIGDMETPVVALLPDETFALKVWLAGVRSLLLRDIGAEKLKAAMVAAYQGLAVLDPMLASAIIPGGEGTPSQVIEKLTPRELEVLFLMAEGLTNKAIAQNLGISEYTIKFHVNAILGKLGAQSRTEAAIRAARLGLITL